MSNTDETPLTAPDPMTPLIAAIDARLAEIGAAEARKPGDAAPLSDHAAEKRFSLGIDGIRNIRRGRRPRENRLPALARFLEMPIEEVSKLCGNASPTAEPDVPKADYRRGNPRIIVRGVVQAGVFVPAFEDQDGFTEVTIPSLPGQETWEKYALRVRGDSMNKFYPEGSIVIVAPFFDVGRPPKPQDHVICLRRDVTDEYEATIKELQLGPDGQLILWPRSTNPDHQSPIHLPTPPHITNWGELHDTGDADVIFAGLVVQAVCPAPYFTGS